MHPGSSTPQGKRRPTAASAPCCVTARGWPDAGFGYGYQTWIFDGDRRMFALIGVHGQAIYVDPTSRLVMVHAGVSKQAVEPNKEALALWRGIVDAPCKPAEA